MAQTLAMAALFVESGAARIAAAVYLITFLLCRKTISTTVGIRWTTSSYSTMDRNCFRRCNCCTSIYRYRRKQCKMKNSKENNSSEKIPVITEVCIGKITDMGIKDANNMGAAMAPAAAQTILDFLSDTNTKPADYDLIVTGDLGHVGSELLLQLMEQEGVDISSVHNDCGKMLFDRKNRMFTPAVPDVDAPPLSYALNC